MKREIKFRGLRTDGKGWVYGHYYEYNNKSYIGFQYLSDNAESGYNNEVIPESVGQFHNALSKKTNGQEVYVGDEISFDLTAGLGEPPSYGHKELVSTVEMCATWYTNVNVIGNIPQEKGVDNG